MAPCFRKQLPAEALPCASSSITPLLLAFALFFGGSIIPSFPQGRVPATTPTDTLRGTVVNSLTHEPIAHAVVYSPDNRFATMTDDRGQFELKFARQEEPPPLGDSQVRYTFPNRPEMLMARKPGFLLPDDGRQGVPVLADQQVLTIALAPEALIVGRILLPTSDYLDRTQVELYRRVLREGREHWDSAGRTRSRADGSYRFAGLQAGAYKLTTQELLDRDPLTFGLRDRLFGYPPVYYPLAPNFSAADIIRLSPGVTFQANASLVRHEYYRVKVGVANAPPGVQVEVWPQGHPGPGYSLGFNAEDDAIEGSLPDGIYTIHAVVYGETTMTGETNITVAGAPSIGSSMALLPCPSISVSVREELQNQEIQNRLISTNSSEKDYSRRPNYLNVNLMPIEEFGYAPSGSLRPSSGPDDESLVIPNVRPGSYRVQVYAGQYYVSSMTSGGADLLRKPLVVSPGSAPPPIEIIVRDDGAQVDGTVEGLVRRRYFENPMVHFVPLPDSGGQFSMAFILPDGQFHISQLAPAAYRVLAFDRQHPELAYATEEELAQYDSRGQIIHVVAHQTEHMRTRLALITRSE